MTRRRILTGTVVLAGIALLSWQGSILADACTTKAQVGQPAPDFKLKDTLGKSHSLRDFKGHIVVLEWTNRECPFVVNHHTKLKTTQQAYARYAPKGVIWLAVDSTHWRKPEQNRLWAAAHHIAYPILHDPTGEVGRAYGAKTTPHVFIIHKDGTLVYSGAIDNQKGHSFVTAALDALLAGKPLARSETKPYGCSVKYGKLAKSGNGGNGGKATAKSGCCPKAAASGNGGECPVKKACCGSADCPATGCGAAAKPRASGNGGNGDKPSAKKACCGSDSCPPAGCGAGAKPRASGNGGNGGDCSKAKLRGGCGL